MEVVCVRARDGIGLGETVEVPDGAEVSGMWFAAPGSAEALRAIADAQAAAEAVQEVPEAVQEPPEDTGPPPEPPEPPAPVLVAPDTAKGM